MLNSFIKFFLSNQLVASIVVVALVAWGLALMPFRFNVFVDQGSMDWFPRDPVAVDAIPDIGENQQIVFTEWAGRSPQDIEDQITFPLTTALLGVPGVKAVRSNSIFGLSSIYLIFEEEIEFYWSRSRILEKLNSLPSGTLPENVQPALGPDATALGQIFWYTLEGRDEQNKPVGGWDPHELRSIQDFYVKYALSSAQGVSEVASVGGYVKEYQVDLDPVAMKGYNINVAQVMQAVKESNLDVGARTIEFNKAEFLVRGLGYIESVQDLEEAVITARNYVPIRVKDVARVHFGPATRRGGLDKGGAEAVGAVVVARYGANPLDVIDQVKAKIKEISPGLPIKTLSDGSTSKVTIVPFYDRTKLIKETLGTLEEALSLEILISIIVVIVMVLNLRASLIISSLLPLGVLISFIAMRYFGVTANIVALSGIAIAIGVMVDIGVVITENIIRHLNLPKNQECSKKERLIVVYEATKEVASAVVTALATTVVSFLPVFVLQGQEGKLFGPLAYTKTFALLAALFVGLAIIPTLAHALLASNSKKAKPRQRWNMALIVSGLAMTFFVGWIGVAVVLIGLNNYFASAWNERWKKFPVYIRIGIALTVVLYFLTREWLPLGPENSWLVNFMFVALTIFAVLALLILVVHYYTDLLRWCLDHKATFLLLPVAILLWGAVSWKGFDTLFRPVVAGARVIQWDLDQTSLWRTFDRIFPGLGNEFMPSLDEGSYLLMPTTMPHSGVEENMATIRLLDQLVTSIPEVEMTVGKWGRAASALDPAPISMFENVINYKTEYITDEHGRKKRFKTDDEGNFVLSSGKVFKRSDEKSLTELDISLLVDDSQGQYFRQWRDHIKSPDDIWNEVMKVTNIPGMTSAPKLQPIATRLIMLSTGMRAPMGIKVFGPSLEAIESTGLQIEAILRQVPGIKRTSVFADRVVGKPYLEIDINRRAIARYGLSIGDIQAYLSAAIGGNAQTMTVEGRERYAVRVRYAREHRDSPENLNNILIPAASGIQIPLNELADLKYVRGPQNIKSENTFLVSYVIFDKAQDVDEVSVVENAREVLDAHVRSGALIIPQGVSYKFTGNYENQVRANRQLSIVIPVSLMVILLILYFQFGQWQSTLITFSGVFVALAGGFVLLWLYGQGWFMSFSLLGVEMRDLFQVDTVHLSVAVWVGFIALFGIATDDGVIMGTYLKQHFTLEQPQTIQGIRQAVLHAGQQRVRPAVMTAATTIIALLPVLTSSGKGSDIMVPMAIPVFGGMIFQVITMFIVPTLYCSWKEYQLKKQGS